MAGRSGRVFEAPKLAPAHVRRLIVEVPIVVGAKAKATLRKAENFGQPGHIWASGELGSAAERVGLVVTVHVPSKAGRKAFLAFDFRRGRRPRAASLTFRALLRLVEAAGVVSDNTKQAFVSCDFELREDRVKMCGPLQALPLDAEPIGAIRGYRIVKEQSGKVLYTVTVDRFSGSRLVVGLGFEARTLETWSATIAGGLVAAAELLKVFVDQEVGRG